MINKIMKLMILLCCVYSIIVLSGCKMQNTNTKSSSMSSSTVVTTNKISDTKYSDNIKDYKIQIDLDKPIKVSYVSQETLESLQNYLDVYGNISSRQPMISDIEDIAGKIAEFREIKVDDEKNYYCIFKSENSKKVYLFFYEFGKNRWRCYYFTDDLNDKYVDMYGVCINSTDF